jgi:DNA-binding PadR family transcriptional regulator
MATRQPGAPVGHLSRPATWVLECLLDDPTREWSGVELSRANGVRAGAVFPVLARLEAVGWLQSRWSDAAPGQSARRAYRLGASGAADVRRALAVGPSAEGRRWGLSTGGAS